MTLLRASAVALALASLVSPRLARACGAYPTPYLTVADTLPASGATAVALDAPVLFHGTSWPTAPVDISVQSLVQSAQVVVKAQGQSAAVEGTLQPFLTWASWEPKAPLDPSTTYEVTIKLTNTAEAPDGASGPTEQQLSFTTGTAKLAPLAITTQPAYSFEQRDLPYCPIENQNDCGGCSQVLTKPGAAVVVTAPVVDGGAPGGYFALARLTNAKGLPEGTVDLSGSIDMASPGATLEFPLPEEEAPYETCLQVTVSDASGNNVQSQKTCFPAGFTGAAGGGGSGGSGVSSGSGGAAAGSAGTAAGSAGTTAAGAGGTAAASGDTEGGGCSASGQASGQGLGLAGLLGLGLLAARQRRATRR